MKNPRNLFTGRRAPLLVLDKEQTLALLDNPGDFLKSDTRWAVKSEYLCEFMNELERTSGFVYNTSAMRAFEKAHDLPQYDDNGSVLSLLVYNAQGYRRGDLLVDEGWIPGEELLETAYREGKKLIARGESIIGGQVEEHFNVRMIEGKLYAMRPRKRKYAINVSKLPCKIAA